MATSIPASDHRLGTAFEAGPTDPSTRSDLHVRVRLSPDPGITIRVASKVEALYGDAIRDDVRTVAERFGADSIEIEVEDRGALPFVITARVEAALLGAGLMAGQALPSVASLPPSDRARIRRSRLYLPGNDPKFMVNAGLHRPDAVILDLEDSVHPDHKTDARILVRNALRKVDFGRAERMVRINQGPLGLDDLDVIVEAQPDLVLIPKVERAEDVRAVAARIAKRSNGRSVWLMPIVESALGVENAFDIASAHESVVAITIGLEDYTADLGVPKTFEGNESLYARSRLVNAARAAGVQAIDSVFGDVGNMQALSEWAGRSRSLGFEGMGCIHPRQISVIHTAFSPSAQELDRAERIVAAFLEAEARGLSVVSLGSRMVDPPVVLRARRLVAQAKKAGLTNGEAR